MSNTYCVVFLFCLSSSCVLNVASFSGLFIFNIPSVLSSVYLLMFLLTIYVHVIENMTMFCLHIKRSSIFNDFRYPWVIATASHPRQAWFTVVCNKG